jgi:hypothetical protein
VHRRDARLRRSPFFGTSLDAVYAQWVEPHLHAVDWLSGLCFAHLATMCGPGDRCRCPTPRQRSRAAGPASGDERGVPPWVLRSRPGCIYPLPLADAGGLAAQYARESGGESVGRDLLAWSIALEWTNDSPTYGAIAHGSAAGAVAGSHARPGSAARHAAQVDRRSGPRCLPGVPMAGSPHQAVQVGHIRANNDTPLIR